MFVSRHVYIALNKTQRWNQIFIFVLCRKTFRMNQQTITEYERLKRIVNEMYKIEINVFVWQFHRVIFIFLKRESLWFFSSQVVSVTFVDFVFRIWSCHWYERYLNFANFLRLILWSWSRIECNQTNSSWDSFSLNISTFLKCVYWWNLLKACAMFLFSIIIDIFSKHISIFMNFCTKEL